MKMTQQDRQLAAEYLRDYAYLADRLLRGDDRGNAEEAGPETVEALARLADKLDPPKPQLGDRVGNAAGAAARVVGLHGIVAWVHWETGGYGTVSLDELEVVR